MTPDTHDSSSKLGLYPAEETHSLLPSMSPFAYSSTRSRVIMIASKKLITIDFVIV